MIILDKSSTKAFAKVLQGLKGAPYIRALVSFAAAPTIERKKPASLVILSSCGKNSLSLWEEHGEDFCRDLGMKQYTLRKTSEKHFVLLYYEKNLERHVNRMSNTEYLVRQGFASGISLEEKLDLLKERFQSGCPHEVGIFLGIPVEDIIGFIANSGQNPLLCKYWKVYHNKPFAEKVFRAYDDSRMKVVQGAFWKTIPA